ncbi:MAG: hypothetical protein H7Y43_04935 [Akkermansiaceae bacterium]|nr:hypothetical protein [Verrucomicrobiales bacterium]
MINLIRSVLREPLLTGAVMLCLMVVGGLILSDWADKRRTRNLLKTRNALRELHLRNRLDPEPDPNVGSKCSETKGLRRVLFTGVRWKFALFSAVVVALVLPRLQSDLDVEAKSPVKGNASTSIDPTSESHASTTVPIKIAASTTNNSSYFLRNIGISLSSPIQTSSDSLSLSTGAGTADCATLFHWSSNETEWDFLSESTDGEFRVNDSIQYDSLSAIDPQRTGWFRQR